MEKEKKPYVLAMYDVRGKQDFIFRTGRIKEIVGGSKIIEDVFKDYLSTKIFNNPNEPFTWDGFVRRLKEGYVGEVVYEGGGNFLLLFRDEDEFKDATYSFTKAVKENIGTLRILGCCVPVKQNHNAITEDAVNEKKDLSNFVEDRKNLYARHALLEASESNIELWPSLPIVQVDRRTSQPLVARWNKQWGAQTDTGGKVSLEVKAKYEKYDEIKDQVNKNGTVYLDNIIKEKGSDSLLAVIYIDVTIWVLRLQNY